MWDDRRRTEDDCERKTGYDSFVNDGGRDGEVAAAGGGEQTVRFDRTVCSLCGHCRL